MWTRSWPGWENLGSLTESITSVMWPLSASAVGTMSWVCWVCFVEQASGKGLWNGPSLSLDHVPLCISWLSDRCCSFVYDAWCLSDASYSRIFLSSLTFTALFLLVTHGGWRGFAIFAGHTRFSPACVSLIFWWLIISQTTPNWEEGGSDLACVNDDTSSYLQAQRLLSLNHLFSLL